MEGQRLQQHRVHDAEDGGVGSYAECQREDGYEEEAGRFQQTSHRVSQVHPSGGHQVFTVLEMPLGSNTGACRSVPDRVEYLTPIPTACVTNSEGGDYVLQKLLVDISNDKLPCFTSKQESQQQTTE